MAVIVNKIFDTIVSIGGAPWRRLFAKTSGTGWNKRIGVGAGIVALLSWQALGSLDRALRLLREPGSDSYDMASLGDGIEGLDVWRRASAALKSSELLRLDGRTIANLHAAVSLVLAASLVVALAMLLKGLRSEKAVGESGVTASRTAESRDLYRARNLIADRSLGLLPLALISLLAEAALEFVVINGEVGSWLLKWSRVGSTAVILAVLAPTIVHVAVFVWSGSAKDVMASSGKAVQVQLTTVGVFGFLLIWGTPGAQVQDGLRRWTFSNPLSLVLTVLAVMLFGLASAGLVQLSRAVECAQINKRIAAKHLVWGGVVTALFGAAMNERVDWVGPGIGVLGGMLVVVGLLSWLIKDSFCAAPPAPKTTADAEPPELVRWIAGLPAIAVAVALVRAFVPSAIGATGPWHQPVLLFFATILFVVIAWVTTRCAAKLLKGDWSGAWHGGIKALLWASIAFFGVLHLTVALWPWTIGPWLGPIAISAIFFAEVAVLLGCLIWLMRRHQPSEALSVLGFTRAPVVLLLAVWAILGALIDSDDSRHDVRVLAEQSAHSTGEAATVEAYFEAWSDRNLAHQSPDSNTASDRDAVPLILVSAEGGGAKAATWTAMVMDCVVNEQPSSACGPKGPALGWDPMFAVSGASGGTVGLATMFAEALAEGNNNEGERMWVEDRLGADLVSPTLAWQFFVEAPTTILRVDPWMSRAEVLERTWSDRWSGETQGSCAEPPGDVAFLGLWNDAERGGCADVAMPLLFANAVSLGDGCRANVSAVDASADEWAIDERDDDADAVRSVPSGPPKCTDGRGAIGAMPVTVDLLDLLCPTEDLRLSSAAFLSARWPYVSPTGRLAGPDGRSGAPCEGSDQEVFMADAGYRDNTGTSTLFELWQNLGPLVGAYNADDTNADCVVPIWIEIKTGFVDPVSAPTSAGILEGLAPLQGALAVFGTVDDSWAPLLEAAIADAQPGEPDRTLQFSMRAFPGVQASSGWAMSDTAMEAMKRQLKNEENQEAFERLAELLDREQPVLQCA